MSDEYPTNEEIQRITGWPHNDAHGLLDFIGSIWHNADWGWAEMSGREGDEVVRVVHASTGGWSGNEDIMDAFRANFLAYHQCFDTYRRGGHYTLMLPQRKP